MKQKYYQRILDAIPEGRENAITQSELAELFCVPERDIRRAIQDARKDGFLILSSTHDGYYYSNRVEDVSESYRLLQSHIRSLKISIRPAKRFLQEHKEEAKHEHA